MCEWWPNSRNFRQIMEGQTGEGRSERSERVRVCNMHTRTRCCCALACRATVHASLHHLAARKMYFFFAALSSEGESKRCVDAESVRTTQSKAKPQTQRLRRTNPIHTRVCARHMYMCRCATTNMQCLFHTHHTLYCRTACAFLHPHTHIHTHTSLCVCACCVCVREASKPRVHTPHTHLTGSSVCVCAASVRMFCSSRTESTPQQAPVRRGLL